VPFQIVDRFRGSLKLAFEEVEGSDEAFFERDLGFPAKEGAGFGDVGAAAGWVVLGQGLKAEFAA
jgi:hypothetical protein